MAEQSEKGPGEILDGFRGRIIFPIFDVAGQPIAVSGRFFEKVSGQRGNIEPAKYVNSPETPIFKKSRTLYGFDRARAAIRKADCILLVEGQFDLVLSHQSGLPFTVALSGTALTLEHLTLLGRLSKRLVLALDADAAGLRSGLKSALMAIKDGFDVKVPMFPEGKDPADVAREDPALLKAAVRESKTAVEFFLAALRGDARDERAYKKAVEGNVLPLIVAMKSAIEREHFIRIAAAKLSVSEEAVRAEVAKVRTSDAPGVSDVPSDSLEVHQNSAESTLTPLEKKAGMLISRFGVESEIGDKLRILLGAQRLQKLAQKAEGEAEALRFRFDAEVGEHTSEEIIAEDMLADIKRHVEREHFKMKFM